MKKLFAYLIGGLAGIATALAVFVPGCCAAGALGSSAGSIWPAGLFWILPLLLIIAAVVALYLGFVQGRKVARHLSTPKSDE
jgi:mannose/fructose/N-acetylgalactosamine-specific phosphotransferase system component IID